MFHGQFLIQFFEIFIAITIINIQNVESLYILMCSCPLSLCCSVLQRQMKELLIRILYCEMLGQNCEWGYIHAVKLTQKGNLFDKRIGKEILFSKLCIYTSSLRAHRITNTLFNLQSFIMYWIQLTYI